MTDMIRRIMNDAKLVATELLSDALYDVRSDWNINIIMDEDLFTATGKFVAEITHKKLGPRRINLRYRLEDELCMEWWTNCWSPAISRHVFYVLFLDALNDINKSNEEVKDA